MWVLYQHTEACVGIGDQPKIWLTSRSGSRQRDYLFSPIGKWPCTWSQIVEYRVPIGYKSIWLPLYADDSVLMTKNDNIMKKTLEVATR